MLSLHILSNAFERIAGTIYLRLNALGWFLSPHQRTRPISSSRPTPFSANFSFRTLSDINDKENAHAEQKQNSRKRLNRKRYKIGWVCGWNWAYACDGFELGERWKCSQESKQRYSSDRCNLPSELLKTKACEEKSRLN